MYAIHRKSILAAALAAALASAAACAAAPLTGTATPAGQPVITVPPRPMAALQMQHNGASDSTLYATGIPGPGSTSIAIPLPAGGSGGSGGGTTCTAGTSTQSQTGACLSGQHTTSGGTTFPQTRTMTESCPSGSYGAPSYSYSGWTPTAATACSAPFCTPNAITSCNLTCGGGSFTYANGGTQTCNSTGTANSACTGTCPGPCPCQGPALCTGPNSPLGVICGPAPGGTYPSTAACIDYGVAGQACNYSWTCGMGGHGTCG